MTTPSGFVFGALVFFGLALMLWARIALVSHCHNENFGYTGHIDWPCKLMGPPTLRGPYRFVSHPSYMGTLLFVMGLAGLAAGWWNVLAVGTVCELLLREWAWRERGYFNGWHR